MGAGIQGASLERGVRSIAAAQALMGREGGAAAQMLIKRFAMVAEIGGKLKLDRRLLNSLSEAGVSATALAAKLGVPAASLAKLQVDAGKLGDAFQSVLAEKGATALERMGLTWASISGKLSDSFEDLFEDMGQAVAPFMQEVKDLFAEFSAGSSAMSPVKSVLMSVLTSLFSLAARVTHGIHYGFLVVQVSALKLAIALAPIVNWFRKIYANALVLQGLKAMLFLLATPFIVIGGAIALVIAGIVILGTIVSAIVGAVVAGLSWLVAASWNAASDFVSGLVSGISSGASKLVAAVVGLANQALSAFKDVLGIHSPSAVMRLQGVHVAAGAAQGIDAGAPMVAASAARLGSDAAAGLDGARGGGARGSMQVTFAPGSIVIDGAGKSARGITEELVALVFERLAAAQGLTST
jgi:hypothetical protein